MPRREGQAIGKRPVATSDVEGDVRPPGVDDDEIRVSVPIDVRCEQAQRVLQAGKRRPQRQRPVATTEKDGNRAGAGIRRGDVRPPVTVEIVHGQERQARARRGAPLGIEGAAALPQENGDGPVITGGDDVRLSVGIEIGDAESGRVDRSGRNRLGCGAAGRVQQEGEVSADLRGRVAPVRHHQVVLTVAVEIGRRDRVGGVHGRHAHLAGERAIGSSGQQGDGLVRIAGIRVREVEDSVAVEVARHDCCGAITDRVSALPRKRAIPPTREYPHPAVSRYGQVLVSIVVQIAHDDGVGLPVADPANDREGPVAVTQKNHRPVKHPVAHDHVDAVVTVQVPEGDPGAGAPGHIGSVQDIPRGCSEGPVSRSERHQKGPADIPGRDDQIRIAVVVQVLRFNGVEAIGHLWRKPQVTQGSSPQAQHDGVAVHRADHDVVPPVVVDIDDDRLADVIGDLHGPVPGERAVASAEES